MSSNNSTKKLTLSRSRPPRGVLGLPGLARLPPGLALFGGVSDMIRRQLTAAASHLVPSLADVARASLRSGLASPKIHAAVTAPAPYYVSGFSSFHGRAALVDTCSPYTTPCYNHHHVHRQQPLRLSFSRRLAEKNVKPRHFSFLLLYSLLLVSRPPWPPARATPSRFLLTDTRIHVVC